MIEPDTPELQQVVAGAPLVRTVTPTRNDLIAVTTAGYQFLEQGQWELARNVFNALIELSPRFFAGYAGLGTVALNERNLPEAVELLAKAFELNSRDPMVLTSLGEATLRLGQPKQAATFLRSCAQLDPGGQNLAANRARAMLAGIEETEARESAQAR